MKLISSITLLVLVMASGLSGLQADTESLNMLTEFSELDVEIRDDPTPISELEWPNCPEGYTVKSAGSGYIPPVSGGAFRNEELAKSDAIIEVGLQMLGEVDCGFREAPVFNFSKAHKGCTLVDGYYTCQACGTFKWRCCKSPGPDAVTF